MKASCFYAKLELTGEAERRGEDFQNKLPKKLVYLTNSPDNYFLFVRRG